MSADPHRPLRDDVRLLGELLGETLREHEGEALFAAVERVRGLSKEARAGSNASFDQLAQDLADMPVETAHAVARAFAHFLNLANVAEQHHRVRRRRAHQRDRTSSPQRGSCDEAFGRLIAAGVAPEQLPEAVRTLHIELVLTAHPTEIARRRLVQKHHRIAAGLAERDRPDLTPDEREAVIDELRREVAGAWGTREVRPERPTVLDEVRSGLLVFEHSLWDAVPRYLRAVDRALRTHTGEPLPIDAVPLRFGSWIGGDRDGNPNVTPDVTRRACLLARWAAATLYLADVAALRDELTLDMASSAMRSAAGRDQEAYRPFLQRLEARLRATVAWIEDSLDADTDAPRHADVLIDAGDLRELLRLCDESLRTTGYGLIADGRLLDSRRRVETFGLTLARLDVRQDAARHAEALTAITSALGLGAYQDWDERTRLDFLTRELAGARPLTPRALDASPEARDTLDTFGMLATIPSESLGAYVITMTSCASDVLAVELLQKEAGIATPLRVVPLFETSRDLENAGAIVDALLGIPWYRERIRGRQEVMIGYSDSAKDVGRLAAGWDLHQAQEQIVAACQRHGVAVTLFHGRGGSVGRGGGPTHLAMMSQPAGSIDGTIRVTEQGEMLQALFGLPDIALRTMEVYTTGTLEAWLTPAAPAADDWRACMTRLRDDSRDAFKSLVYDDPRFVDYFHEATPEAELAAMNIGSRPARRQTGRADGVRSLRAIPWQFAWTQTRLLLGAWLGVEVALEQALARGERGVLRAMYTGWPFFRAAIDLIEMVLAKADARIAAEYDRRLVPVELAPLGVDLRQRLARATAGVREITGADLLAGNPVLRRSIDVRNPYVDPINLVQIELLRRFRSEPDDRVKAALLVTVNGVAAGMRNTG